MSKKFDERKNQLENAFPVIDPPILPLSNKILVQHRTERQTSGLILKADQSKDDAWTNQVVKVVDMGPLCFYSRDFKTGSLVPFKEPAWFKVGYYVRIPQHGMDRLYKVPTPQEMEVITKVSEEARKHIARPVFVADKGLGDRNSIKYSLLEFSDVLAIVKDPLAALNNI